MNNYIHRNQQLWDEWADINYRSAMYDVSGFKTTPGTFDRFILDEVGNVTGKSLLHLQCHFGKDTLRWALLGATVTGIDFSEKAIVYARQLATDMHIAATFIQTNLYDLPQTLTGQFDIIYTSYGVLGWLPDLERWGQIIGQFLKPGGIFYIVEAHPTLMIFDDHSPADLQVQYPYFYEPEPVVVQPHQGNYADPQAISTQTEYSWQHSLEDIIMPLLKAGLRLGSFHEYAHVPWQALRFLVRGEDGYWHLPPNYPQIPLTFALRAIKMETS